MATIVNNPYTLAALKKNLTVSSEIDRTSINMRNYARNNIPNYANLTTIPSGHLPANLPTKKTTDWGSAFASMRKLQTLPNPFYNMNSAVNCYQMFYDTDLRQVNITFGPTVKNASYAVYGANLFEGNVYVYSNECNCYNIVYSPHQAAYNRKTLWCYEGTNTAKSIYSWLDNKYYNLIEKLDVRFFNGGPELGMQAYAMLKIPSYNTITTIPSAHLPAAINHIASNSSNWVNAFGHCTAITSFPNPFYNTEKLTDATNMFYLCKAVTNLKQVNLSSAKNLGLTFYGCEKLTHTNVPDLRNAQVTELNRTFYFCKAFTALPTLPAGVQKLIGTFQSCFGLISVTNIPNTVTDLSSAFEMCTSLKTVTNIPNSVTNMYNTFSRCWSMITPPTLPQNVTMLAYTFNGCTNLKSMPVIPNKVTNMESTFSNCYNMTTVTPIPEGVVTMANTFYGCNAITEFGDIPASVTSLTNTFNSCRKLNKIGAIKCTNPNTSFYSTFGHCDSLTTAPIFNDNIVGNFTYTFTSCNALVCVPQIPKAATNLYSTFLGCKALETAPVIPENAALLYRTFQNCSALKGDIIILCKSVTNATNFLANCSTYNKNVCVYKDSTTYNTFYLAMGNSTYNSNWNANLVYIGANINFTGQTEGTVVVVDGVQYDLNTTTIVEVTPGSKIIECYNKDYGKREIPITVVNRVDQTVNITFETTNNHTVTYGLSTTYNKSIIKSISISYDSISYSFGPEDLDSQQKGYIKVPSGSVVTLELKYYGYKRTTHVVTVVSDITYIASDLIVTDVEEVVITGPFTETDSWLTNLVDGSNFEISGNYIQSGSTSYNTGSGKSYGYIKFTTPSDTEDLLVSVSCYTSSENRYDFGAVYVGTAIYQPSSYSAIRNGTTDGNGSYLYRGSGAETSGATYTLDTSLLQPNTEYYINFMYVKDSGGNTYSDRFFISEIKFNAKIA